MTTQTKPTKRINLYPGVGSRDYALMGGANAKVKRNPDGSAADDQGGTAGAYADPDGNQPAFPSSAAAFPESSA
jgi:hypothetical protein